MKKFNCRQLLEMLSEDGQFSREIGICIEDVDESSAKGSIKIEKKHLNPMGMVHGGCVYSLADTIAGIAASAHGNYVVTICGSLNYLEPAANTDRIHALARQLRFGGHLAVYEVEITDDGGKLLAKGEFSYFNTGNAILAGEEGTEASGL